MKRPLPRRTMEAQLLGVPAVDSPRLLPPPPAPDPADPRYQRVDYAAYELPEPTAPQTPAIPRRTPVPKSFFVKGVDFTDTMTPAEVAQLFRVDPKTVTRWAAAGKLTTIRTLGGQRRFSRAQCEALARRDAQ